MDDSTNPTTAPVVADLIDWLNSSLCNCIKKEISDQPVDGQEIPTSLELDEAVLVKLWQNGMIFQWLLHSFKPDLISCPSILSGVNERDFTNLQLTFKIAQEEFGVQNLLLPDDIPNESGSGRQADALILLTYLAQLKYALRNLEPACSNVQSELKLQWRLRGENDVILLKPISEAPNCHDCQEKVLILDRLLIATTDNAHHRRCFRCERCRKLLRIGLYRPSKSGTGFECLEHEKEDLINRLTPAPDPKPKATESKPEEAKENVNKEKIYPEIPKREDPNLYPQLASPGKKVLDVSIDSGVVSESPDVAGGTPGKGAGQLSPPPVQARSRSSDRDAPPVPTPRKSVHTRGGSDVTTSSNSSENVSPMSPDSASSTSKPVSRPTRPALPPKPKVQSNVPPQIEYPEELNPFGDPEPTERRHSMPIREIEKPIKMDQRKSIAVEQSIIQKPVNNAYYDDSLNPFGSESESEEDEAKEDNDDASSLSSTNPFNESGDETEPKNTRSTDVSQSAAKRVPPPPRPPPPSKSPAGPATGTIKPSTKKRPAPPPPPPMAQAADAKIPPPRPASPKKLQKKKRPAPPRPLPLKRQIRTESTLSPEQVAKAFEENDNSLVAVEMAASTFESDLRGKRDEQGFAALADDAIGEWIEHVHKRFDLVRKETELVYICRERQLDELHAEIEFQLRCIIEKPESEKTSEDMDREASLLQRMLDIIEEKSKLVDSQDDMRAQSGAMMARNSVQLDDSSLSTGSASKSSTLDKSSGTKDSGDKQTKKKKKIKLRLKKLKQKIASTTLVRN